MWPLAQNCSCKAHSAPDLKQGSIQRLPCRVTLPCLQCVFCPYSPSSLFAVPPYSPLPVYLLSQPDHFGCCLEQKWRFANDFALKEG